MPEAIVAAVIVGGAMVGTTIYSAQRQKSDTAKAIRAQKQTQAKQLAAEAKAGEYYQELNAQQMKLQAEENQLSLLADLIKNRQQTPLQVYTLPPAKEPAQLGFVEQINQTIHKLLTG